MMLVSLSDAKEGASKLELYGLEQTGEMGLGNKLEPGMIGKQCYKERGNWIYANIADTAEKKFLQFTLGWDPYASTGDSVGAD